jgi:hypothetical protein
MARPLTTNEGAALSEESSPDRAARYATLWLAHVDSPSAADSEGAKDESEDNEALASLLGGELAFREPWFALRVVVAVLDLIVDRAPGADDVIAQLGLGVTSDVLDDHGGEVIDWVEETARRRPDFREVLGSLWRGGMSDELWSRVTAAAPPRREMSDSTRPPQKSRFRGPLSRAAFGRTTRPRQ